MGIVSILVLSNSRFYLRLLTHFCEWLHRFDKLLKLIPLDNFLDAQFLQYIGIKPGWNIVGFYFQGFSVYYLSDQAISIS